MVCDGRRGEGNSRGRGEMSRDLGGQMGGREANWRKRNVREERGGGKAD